MPPLPLDRLFDPTFLFDINPGYPSDWYSILAALFGLILIAAQGLYLWWARPAFARDPYRLRLARRVALTAGSVSSVAILLIAARYLTIPFLSMRFLLILTILVGLGLLAYFAFYMVRVFPTRSAVQEREAARQRYLPQQRPRQVPAVARKKKKGKKKK